MNIIDEETALQMFEKTGVDGIMIGRGSFGNPWIFDRIKHYLKTGEKMPETSIEEKYKVLKEHIKYEMKYKPELIAIHELRKPIAWYTKSLPNSSEFRNNINKIENREILEQEIEKYFHSK